MENSPSRSSNEPSTKAADDIAQTPFETLCLEPEQLNPAIILAEDLMRRDAAELLSTQDVKRAEEVLQVGAKEIEVIERHLAAVKRSQPTAWMRVPLGF